jgi:hypothetical protein
MGWRRVWLFADEGVRDSFGSGWVAATALELGTAAAGRSTLRQLDTQLTSLCRA